MGKSMHGTIVINNHEIVSESEPFINVIHIDAKIAYHLFRCKNCGWCVRIPIVFTNHDINTHILKEDFIKWAEFMFSVARKDVHKHWIDEISKAFIGRECHT